MARVALARLAAPVRLAQRLRLLRLAPALSLAALSACGSGAPELAPAWSAPPQRGRAEACADCHAQLVESYGRSPMARALGAVHASELCGLAPVLERESGFRYALEVRAESGWLLETQAEQPDFLQAYELRFAIGAGELDRSYVARHGSFLWLAPLEVLSLEGGRRSALSPAHSMHPGTRLSSAITAECLGCHTDELPPPGFPLNLDPASGWKASGISCGACHGPVEAHRGWREEELDGARPAGPDPVLRLGQRTRVERMSVCAACHLQGDARIVLERGVLGPPPPGRDLLQSRAVFVAAHAGDEIGFVSQTERLVESACYLQDAELSCQSCHDPHRSLKEPGERVRVRAACGACHASPGSAGPRGDAEPAGAASSPLPQETQTTSTTKPAAGTSRALAARAARSSRPTSSACALDAARLASELAAGRDCVSCHMPLTPVFDVAGLSIHDHFIRRRPRTPPAPAVGELRFCESADGDWRRFTWPSAPAPAHIDDPGLWLMALVGGGQLPAAQARVDERPGPTAAGLPMYHHVRASLLESLDRPEEAQAEHRRALELDPELASSAINLGWLLARLGRAREGLGWLDAVIERHPEAEGALRNRALIHNQLGDARAAARDLQRAFVLLPTRELARALAACCEQAGDLEGARNWSLMSALLDPRP